MDTKAAFEKWWKEDSGQADICSGSFLGSTIKMVAHQAWLASRVEIEIELPVHCNGISSEAAAYDDALDECIEAITSHGIRIKGKTS